MIKAINNNLIYAKAIQNISGKAINIWDVLIENPENNNEIITISKLTGKKCMKSLRLYFSSGYANSMFKECDREVIAKSLGFDSFELILY